MNEISGFVNLIDEPKIPCYLIDDKNRVVDHFSDWKDATAFAISNHLEGWSLEDENEVPIQNTDIVRRSQIRK